MERYAKKNKLEGFDHLLSICEKFANPVKSRYSRKVQRSHLEIRININNQGMDGIPVNYQMRMEIVSRFRTFSSTRTLNLHRKRCISQSSALLLQYNVVQPYQCFNHDIFAMKSIYLKKDSPDQKQKMKMESQ